MHVMSCVSSYSASLALRSQAAGPLQGRLRVPGDKSISHRAVLIASMAVGESLIEGLSEGEDVHRTLDAVAALGASVSRKKAGVWSIQGCGVGGFMEPRSVLDLQNSGTGARLLMGILASHPFTSVMTGDVSLRNRPMQRVMHPLQECGARFIARADGYLPVTILGASKALPLEHALSIPSAQVKSALLFAGLNAPGRTVVIEPRPSRDHTERMLQHFGADISVSAVEEGGKRIMLMGQPELTGRTIRVPADPSSAAFPVVAAVLTEGSQLVLENVGINNLRCGLYVTLQEMGARLSFENKRIVDGEPVADIHVTSSSLKGITVPANRAPSMIDEYPILAIAAALADGETRMCGLGELKVKESDRLAAMASGLSACGVKAVIEGTDLVVTGSSVPPAGGTLITARHDHRIAMSFLILGSLAKQPISVDGADTIATSFPDFVENMRVLGMDISKEKHTII